MTARRPAELAKSKPGAAASAASALTARGRADADADADAAKPTDWRERALAGLLAGEARVGRSP